MSHQNIQYFAVVEDQITAIELSFKDLDSPLVGSLAIYSVDLDINDMSTEDLLLFIPAFHKSPKSFVRQAGINLYSGTIPTM